MVFTILFASSILMGSPFLKRYSTCSTSAPAPSSRRPRWTRRLSGWCRTPRRHIRPRTCASWTAWFARPSTCAARPCATPSSNCSAPRTSRPPEWTARCVPNSWTWPPSCAWPTGWPNCPPRTFPRIDSGRHTDA